MALQNRDDVISGIVSLGGSPTRKRSTIIPGGNNNKKKKKEIVSLSDADEKSNKFNLSNLGKSKIK